MSTNNAYWWLRSGGSGGYGFSSVGKSLYDNYSMLKWIPSLWSSDKSRFVHEEYFGDSDITIINCCTDIADKDKIYSFARERDALVNIVQQYVSAIVSVKYKLSSFKWYNREIKKGLLLYISNVYKNYNFNISSEDNDKEMVKQLVELIHHGCYLQISAKKFDKFLDLANEYGLTQDIADLIEYRHNHYGNSIDSSKFKL